MKTAIASVVGWAFFLALLVPDMARALPQATSLPDNVSSSGVISVPKKFRTDFVFLGSWFLELKEQDGKLMQHVYSRKEDVEAFQKTGQWPDGAMLIKEQLQAKTSDSKKMTESFAGHSKGIFVMVKDREKRFSGNPLWGDGWGWSLFAADKPAQPVTRNYQSDCLSCHEPARDSDLVFIKGYPLLNQPF